MISLALRTEYSFRAAYGPLGKVLDRVEGPFAGIADRNGTWGHSAWAKECKKRSIKPLFGVELAVCSDASKRERLPINWMRFIAANDEGLQELYRLVSIAHDEKHFYYSPRLDYSELFDLSENVFILSGFNPDWGRLPRRETLFIEVAPSSSKKALAIAEERGFQIVAAQDNYFPSPTDRKAYEVLAARERMNRIAPMHIVSEDEWLAQWHLKEGLQNAQRIAEACSASLGFAHLPKIKSPKTLKQMCVDGAKKRGLDISKEPYKARLERELKLILEKEFEDYFFIITDLIQYAKQHMLVGPARGSSCGSLTCYLLGITDIDPIPYNLLFERFIDINRADLPDIDIDFQDTRREMVFTYLIEKYGRDCVARIGNVNRLKAKSAIGDVAKELGIPQWELADLKGSIIERSSGDSRANLCIMDSFAELEIGRMALAKYPGLAVSAELENHASHCSTHAAGVCITSQPITNYASFDIRQGIIQGDKKDAESLGLLKIDALGLRSLSVIQDCLDQVGLSRQWLLDHRRDDQQAFDVLNRLAWAGLFQFEGFALQTLCRQFTVNHFEDIASLLALGRPGPFNSGAATEWIKRRKGVTESHPLHPSVEPITRVSYGLIIYQEQVMEIARQVGKLSWEEVSELRKAMSKTLGDEFFGRFKSKFLEGAKSQKMKADDAARLWENINTMGSYSFNRSHAVSYALVSYWTLLLKAKYPLEFAAACLRNAANTEQGIKLLRELKKEGFKYRTFDAELSQLNWSVQNGELIGGLTAVKGIGEKKAQEIIKRRASGDALPLGLQKLLKEGVTPYDSAFESVDRFGDLLANPEKYNVTTRITPIDEFPDDEVAEILVLAKLKAKIPRDLNEMQFIQNRGGRVLEGEKTKYLNLELEDDTGTLQCTISRWDYARLAVPILETGQIGDWYLMKGMSKVGWPKLYIKRIRKMEHDCPLTSPNSDT